MKKMIEAPSFEKKKIIIFAPKDGDKMTYLNDNIVIRDKDNKIKYQSTCYQLFAIMVLGNVSITSGLIQRANRFKYSIVMMTPSFRTYQIISGKMEGNTLLRKLQYEYTGMEIGKHLILNKIQNQRNALNKIRKKVPSVSDAIEKLDLYIKKLAYAEAMNLQELMGIEGSASRVYFSQMFIITKWKGRKPRVKNDFVNTVLDIGYTMLFNFIDSLLSLYGFDVYVGVLHRNFYMRKSLVCDLMEPFRPLVDWKIRCAINLGQCKEDDFELLNNQWVLKYKKNSEYSGFIMETILDNKMEIFYYIQQYYRSFMKRKDAIEFPVYEMR